MRLGQLARQLSIKTEDIVSFLASQNIVIDSGNNTRLEEIHVDLILQRFAPNNEKLQEEIVHQADQQEVEAIIPALNDEVPGETAPEPPEVIKAPKIELQGLRVLGKIELPEKKLPVPPAEPEHVQQASVERTPYTPRREQRSSQPRERKNPIVLAREREERERKEKLEKQREVEKQRRTEFYLKRLKPQAPTRAVRMVEEETIEMPPLEERPKTWWGRFMKWLNT